MKHLIWGALALALGGCGGPKDATANAAAVSGSEKTAPTVDAPVTFDRWVEKSDTSPMDNSVNTRIAAISDGIDPGAKYAAMLFLQCTGPKLDAFVATDDVVDYHSDEVAMRVRVDSAPAVAESWTQSTDGRGAFSQSPRELLAKLRTAHRLLLEIPIYGKGPQVASWTLDGLSSHLASLASCVKS